MSLSRNPVIFNIAIIAAVTAVLYLVGVPSSLYKGFVTAHMVLLVICGVSGFLLSTFENYQYAFQPWKQRLLASIASVFIVATAVTFIGWPAFGAFYALYFWLST